MLDRLESKKERYLRDTPDIRIVPALCVGNAIPRRSASPPLILDAERPHGIPTQSMGTMNDETSYRSRSHPRHLLPRQDNVTLPPHPAVRLVDTKTSQKHH